MLSRSRLLWGLKTKHGYKFISDYDARAVGGAHPSAHLWDNGDNAVESVLFGDNGVEDSLKSNSFVIDFSTISPNKSISIHKRLAKKNTR